MSNSKNHWFDECDFEPECCVRIEPCHRPEPCHKPEPKCHRKSVLHAISLATQTVAAGLAVPFDTNLATDGTDIVHIAGGADESLLTPGLYKVIVTTSVTPVGTTAGIALAVNGIIIPGTTVTTTVIAGTITTLTTQTIIQVSPLIATTLRLVNPTGGTETFTDPNMIIEKL